MWVDKNEFNTDATFFSWLDHDLIKTSFHLEHGLK